ncbi:MAG: sulfotransferase family 2 domain-containing protein [Pseudomonadota bacterium]
MSGFTHFILLAGMRTGSNLLEANLNLLDGVACHGEAFNPSFIGYPKAADLLGTTLQDRERDPDALLAAIKASAPMPGFRYFHDHDPRILQTCLRDQTCAKVILTRDPLESFVSWKIAQATGQWKLTNASHAKTAQITFDPEAFRTHLDAVSAFQQDVQKTLQTTGQTAFRLTYDDLRDVDVINGLAAFLGVATRLPNVRKKLKKQNPTALAEKVTNPEVMAETTAQLCAPDLGHHAALEPTRGPAIPTYLAAPRSALMYLPLRSGPDIAVRQWLAAVDSAEEEDVWTGLSRRDLRDWQEGNLPHRSFAVLRHPLARAHAAFCDRILSDGPGGFPDIREKLTRVHGLPLPAQAPDLRDTGAYDDAAHRAGFLGFLEFLRLNLNGQTSLRVDPSWASQQSILQGISQVIQPDLVLREEAMEAGLQVLAEQLGIEATPALPETHHPHHHRLAAIYDSTLEAAARQACRRDYTAFGFSDYAG